jgi:uncharacterized protein
MSFTDLIATPWIQTYTGRAFDLLDPKPEQIDPLDIAHALSNLCRFTGHAREFYSVAQHSCLVAEITRDLWDGPQPCPAVVCLAALLHDAAEAYIGDVSTPLKRALRLADGGAEYCASPYDSVEAVIERAVLDRFGATDAQGKAHTLIKRADLIALATEHAQLFTGPPPRSWGLELPQPWPYKITPWAPAMAQVQFLQAFGFYGGGK